MNINEKITIKPVSVDEARIRLRLIIPILKKIRANTYRYNDLEKQFKQIDYDKYSNLRYKLDTIEEANFHLYREVNLMDCIIKDPWIGLIDFVSRIENRRVWLCYKLGEEGLQYYHGWNDGFIGRRLIE